VKREILVDTAKSCNEVVLKSADTTFGCIAAVDVWGYKLVVDRFCLHKVLEDFGAFVIEALELGAMACFDEHGMERFVGFENAFSSARCHGFGNDSVAVVIVEDHDVVVAVTGRNDEFSSLVGVDLSSKFVDSDVAEMCTFTCVIVVGEEVVWYLNGGRLFVGGSIFGI